MGYPLLGNHPRSTCKVRGLSPGGCLARVFANFSTNVGYSQFGNHPTGCCRTVPALSPVAFCDPEYSHPPHVLRLVSVRQLLYCISARGKPQLPLPLPNAGYLWLVHKMPAGIPYPSGEIRVLSPNLQDMICNRHSIPGC